jgi:hypothetical protein
MGLLDDAIREHLELKRKHGAGDEELSRQETEALGPARRDFATPDGAAAEQPAAAVPSDDAAAGYEPEPPAEPAGWLDEDPPEVEPLERAAEPTVAHEPPPAPLPAPEPPARNITEVPTQGFDALSADEEPADEDAEDVLEETPDFLQDTPEHDRLWFEQKPPRDFDFDE